jgi:hypothetical protein
VLVQVDPVLRDLLRFESVISGAAARDEAREEAAEEEKVSH